MKPRKKKYEIVHWMELDEYSESIEIENIEFCQWKTDSLFQVCEWVLNYTLHNRDHPYYFPLVF